MQYKKEKVENHYKNVLPSDLLEDINYLKFRNLNVLIIEDHPLITESIIKALKAVEVQQNNYRFNIIDTANTLEIAYKKLLKNLKEASEKYDLVMLDIKLPVFKEKQLFSGENLGIWINENFNPKPITIVTTTHTEEKKILNIFKSINPAGFIVKSDVNSELFVEAIKKSIEDEPYYSDTINKAVRKRIASTIILDPIDIEMLQHIKECASIKELMTLMNKTRSAVEKIRYKLMDKFNIEDNSNMKLIAAAKELGFI